MPASASRPGRQPGTGARMTVPGPVTLALMAASAAMFAACLWSAWVLAGRRVALGFAALALALGWFAEEMGSTRGWFFGRYQYTDVLGPALGHVPLAIPLMWFALCWIGWVMAHLMLWRAPAAGPSIGMGVRAATAWLGAMVVTAFDLGADPYFVFVLRAWVMDKTDGGWFGETLQGFVGWMGVSFLILLLAAWWAARGRPAEDAAHAGRPDARQRRAAAVPLLIYASGLVFQLLFGQPIEVRAVAFFAMGLPLFVAAVAWWQWAHGEPAA